MSYYDWQHLTKPWKIVPVEQDKTVNTKALSITPVEDVSPKFITLWIPPTPFDVSMLMVDSNPIPAGNLTPPQMVGQFNYSVSAPFSLNGTDIIYDSQIAYCVRWREGGGGNPTGKFDKVYRYVLGNLRESDEGAPLYLPFPRYTGQTIKPNFVIEVWLKRNMYLPDITVPAGGISINTGLLYYPPDADIPTPRIEPLQIAQLSDLLTPLDETVPTTVNPVGPWLPNGSIIQPP